MWLVEHLGTKIVVSVASTRAAAYEAKRSIQAISGERYRVVHS